MNRQELIAAVAANSRVKSNKTEVASLVNATIEAITQALVDGDSVRLGEFGTLKVIERAFRVSRNISTGDAVDVPAHKTVKFMPATALREKLNK